MIQTRTLNIKTPSLIISPKQVHFFVSVDLESTFLQTLPHLQVEMKAVNHFPRIGDAIEVPGIWGVYDQLREGSRPKVDHCTSRRRIFWT